MKFRFYQLYFVLAAVLLVAAMCNSLLYALAPNGATYTVGNFSLTCPDGSTSYSVVALGVVLIVAAVVNAFARSCHWPDHSADCRGPGSESGNSEVVPETVAGKVFGDYLRRGGAQSDYEQYTIKL